MTTDRYIRMCSTPLVQEKWEMKVGGNIVSKGDELVWLPQQEDWQEMIQPISTDELMLKFYQWYHKIWFVYQMANNTYSLSITELWCAFYFHEVHGMIWNDEKGWEK